MPDNVLGKYQPKKRKSLIDNIIIQAKLDEDYKQKKEIWMNEERF